MSKVLVLLLQLSLCFAVFADDENLVSWVALPPHHHGGYHSVTPSLAPSPPPHHHHHHHHHSHPPTSAPTPTPPPTPAPTTPPAHPPSHHHGHPPGKGHVQPPTSHPPPHPPAAHPPPHPPTSHPPPHPPTAHPPPHPPAAHPPPHPPTPHPPVYPPKPSHPFQRKLVAVEGVVFLKSCKYAGHDTLSEATPLAGAIVQLQCNNTAKPLKAQAYTDKNGYFLLLGPKTVTNYAVHKCKASLVPSKLPLTKEPSDLHGGVSGAVLNVDKKKPFVTINSVEYALFHVGPFAFEPKCPH